MLCYVGVCTIMPKFECHHRLDSRINSCLLKQNKLMSMGAHSYNRYMCECVSHSYVAVLQCCSVAVFYTSTSGTADCSIVRYYGIISATDCMSVGNFHIGYFQQYLYIYLCMNKLTHIHTHTFSAAYVLQQSLVLLAVGVASQHTVARCFHKRLWKLHLLCHIMLPIFLNLIHAVFCFCICLL